MRRRRGLAVLGLLVVSASACAQMGTLGGLGDVIGGGSNVYGEVRSVDARRGRIEVREQYGRDQTVRFDNRTRVVYQNREYPVSSLERGDQVQMRVEYDRNNTAWTDHIEVRSSARRTDRRDDRRDDDRGDVWGTRVERLDGRVQGVDERRGYFTLTQNRGQRVLVYMPRNARREDIRRFERLRRGERVRVDVRSSGRGDQAELVRFR
jgi:cold shock CspA family protein